MGTLSVILGALREYWPPLLLIFAVIRLFRNRYKPGLRDIPGPFLASLTDVWLFAHCLRGRGTTEYLLHRRYNSPLLRLGPNTISVSDAEAVRVIYGYKPVFKKSRLYITQSYTSKDGEVVPNLASTMDEELHAKLRRPVANAYAMTTLIGYEPLVDSTFSVLLKELETRFVNTGEECPLDQWLQMYTFDTVGEMTFSKRFGFLESGKDLDNMMSNVSRVMNYTGIVGQLPTWDEYLRVKNVLLRRIRKAGNVVKWTVKQIRDHEERQRALFKHVDFLTRFIQAREKYPDLMTDARITDFANTNVGAGSDTTAIILRECVYQILTHPDYHHRVLEEIKQVFAARPPQSNPDAFIRWEEGIRMEFTQAIIKEALRTHPPLGQILPRVVPPGGMEICGKTIPGGTVVGCNAWTVHRDKKVYGNDADEFRPERWLDQDEEYIRNMSNLTFAFGGGPRTCIGKNIALMIITKFVPELLRRFEIELVDPARYKSVPGWLVPQRGLDVRLKSPPK